MNLRDKLNAIGGKPKPKPPAPKISETCWQAEHFHDMEEFPWHEEVDEATVMLMQQEPMPAPLNIHRILYLDTETTGFLGAGTVAFMVGVGWLTDEGFTVRQYVMRDYPEELALLRELEALLERFDVVCTFNGRTFDLPLLKTRFLMNRMRTDCLEKPHIDLLHIARRVFRLRLQSCNLGHLEEAILGQTRIHDLPGSEAPQRYFAYLKTGEFHLLDEVLTHNEQDIASLCTLLAHMCHVYRAPEHLSHAEDVLSMGVALERMRHPEEARRCYHLVSMGKYHAQGQMRLAQSLRRSGQREDAREVWLQMIERREGGVRPYIELAKHYEHVEKNFGMALSLTRQAIGQLAEPTLLETEETQQLRQELQKRYERLKRKQKGT